MTDQTSDETIIVRYVIEAQDAITKAKEFRANVDAIKNQLKSMAAASGQSFKDLAVGMQQVAKTDLQNSIVKIKTDLQSTIAPIKANKEAVREANQDAAASIKQASDAYNQYKNTVTRALQEVTKESKTASQVTQTGTTQVKSSLSSIAIGVAAAFGISAINMVRQFFQTFINFAQQAIQSGYEYAKGLYQISVAVNALRRAGTNITFGDVLEQLQKLKSEFGIFATKDLVVGAAAFLNLNRDMGFTKEQLFSLQEAIATLAVVNGRSMDEVQKTVALALSSGYTEGLQRLGVSINRVTIAEEAARLGYAKSYMALTEQQRALATYNLVLQKTKVYAQDLYNYQKTLPGAIDAANARIIDANAKLGENLLSLRYLWVTLKAAVLDYASYTPELNKTGKMNLQDLLAPANLFTQISLLSNAIAKIIQNWDKVKKAFKESFVIPLQDRIQELLKPIQSVIDKAKELSKIEPFNTIIQGAQYLMGILDPLRKKMDDIAIAAGNIGKAFSLGFTGVLGRELLDFGEKLTDILHPKISTKPAEITKKETPVLTEEQVSAVESAEDQILDLQKQYDNDRRDLAIDLQRDLADIEEKGQDELDAITAKHAKNRYNISQKADADIIAASDKYNLDVSQTWDDYYSNVASASEKHSNRLLKIEEDYQEKLKRLKEGFLLDMEDALEARDARQVLRLIRQYNLDRTQTKREYEQNLKDEERNYREQLNELDRQRNDRLRKLKQEFDLRTAEIIKQRDRELDLERKAEAQELYDQEAQNKWDIDNRKKKYQQDLDDLALHLQDRTNAIAQGLINDGIATAQGLQGILDATLTYIGPDGVITEAWANFIAYIQAAMAAAMAIPNTTSFTGQQPTYPTPTAPGYAKGGVVITNNPAKAKSYAEGGILIASNPIKAKSYAQGGMEIADKPTVAVFGDAGKELHLFLPLTGSISSLTSQTKAPLPEIKTGNKDKLQVEIMLGQGLEGKIIDRTLDRVASVVLRSVK